GSEVFELGVVELVRAHHHRRGVPRASERELVLRVLEDLDRAVDHRASLGYRELSGGEARPDLLDARQMLDPGVADCGASVGNILEQRFRAERVAAELDGNTEHALELERPLSIAVRERKRAREEVDGCGGIDTLQGSDAGVPETGARFR